MPRNYKRKTEKNSWDPEKLKIALSEIKKGRKIREVARAFIIPESTIRKQMKAENPGATRLGRKAVFSPEVEAELKEYVLTLAKLFYGLTPSELRRLAFKYAEQYNMNHAFSSEKHIAGKDWLYGFLRRNPEIKLRQPEGTSINRIASFNSESTKKFFANLKMLMDIHNFPPHKIFNMDETGVTVVQKKCPKVYGPKGAKKIGAAISAERGRTITAVFAVSAAGQYCPPMLIYPRKRMSPALQRNGPIGALYTCSKNGWINTDLFVKWLEHFEKSVNPTEIDPVLLILDNHSSHISLEAYTFCKCKFIHMVSLPPHTSDHLQPLDLTIFGPLKNQLYREYDLQLTNTGHTKISEYELAELLNRAFLKIATMEKAISGFRTAGIFPFNPDKFTENDFAAADHMRPLVVESVPDEETAEQASQNVPPESDRTSTIDVLPSTSHKSPVNQGEAVPLQQVPSTSSNSFFSFAPIPKKKSNPKAAKRKSRNKQCSEILTSTPIKEQLEIAQEKRKIAADKKAKNVIKKLKLSDDKKKDNNIKQKKTGTRKRQLSESSSESDVSNAVWDDDEQDDDDIFDNAVRIAEPNEVCGICNEFGRNRELWYRCVSCSTWNHAACTSADRADGYVCDYCTAD